MNTAQTADVLWVVLALVLVGSALFSRRFSLRGAIGMVVTWIMIFGAALVLFSYRSEFGQVAQRVQSEVTGSTMQQVQGQTLRLKLAADGHYWANGAINGTEVRFLVDSGATITAVSNDTAQRAGLNVDRFMPGVIIQTGNGPVKAQRSNVATLSLGPIQTSDLPVVIASSFGDMNVLGMNFLSRLKSWRVENGEMVLEP